MFKHFKKFLCQLSMATIIFSTYANLFMATSFAINNARLDFSPNSGTYFVGDEFNLKVTIDTDTPANAVDAIINYSNDAIEVLSITPGDAFQAYPGLQFNNNTGEIKITGFSLQSFQGSGGTVATIRVLAKNPSPNAEFNYDFTLQNPPLTTDSNVAHAVNSTDILQSVGSASFQFIPDTNPPYTTNWNPAPNAIDVSRNTNIAFRIKDDERGVDINSVKVKVNGLTYSRPNSEFNFSGTKKNYLIVINPSADFNYSQLVNIELDGADIDGNQMNTFKYNFRISDAPPTPNVAPVITDIKPVEKDLNGQTRKLLEVTADDPDAPNTDLKLTVNGVPANAPFTDNGDGTGTLDYTDITPGNYFVTFTATDAGNPNLSGSDGTWLMIATPNAPTPPPPPGNQPPRFKNLPPIEVSLNNNPETGEINPDEVIINVEATDPDNDPLILEASSSEMLNFSFIDLGNGAGTFSWTPTAAGIFTAAFKATDPGNLSDTLIVTVFVQGDNVCPLVAAEEEIICKSEDNVIADSLAEKLSPEMTVTRAEAAVKITDALNIIQLKKDQLDRCNQNLQQCLLIFRNQSNFTNLTLNSNNLILYPDLDNLEQKTKNIIDDATKLGILTGYYGDDNSPFKPNRVITKVEAISIILRSLELVPNLYRDELVTILGSEKALAEQASLCQDVDTESQWWYPRYLNKAFEMEALDDSNCRPDQFISDAELDQLLEKIESYSTKNRISAEIQADSDNDRIRNYDEINIFNTDPNKADSDGDGLSDYDEIFVYKTNPLKSDSDQDGLSDQAEIESYQTNPLNPDSDQDGFTDAVEIAAGTNPNSAQSIPSDANGNQIDDQWEAQYQLFVNEPLAADQDSDQDGLSDKLEYQYGTNPLVADSDNDGVNDGDEILLFFTNPLVANDPADIAIQVTNLKDGQTIATRSPIIQGIAPANSEVLVLAQNSFGQEILLGKALSQENQIFIFKVPFELQDGEYLISFRILDATNQQVIRSNPIRIIIDPSKIIAQPTPEKIDQLRITDDVLLKNIKLEIVNNRPIVKGHTDSNNHVIATWNSLVFSSALIADQQTGEFAIHAPKELTPGDHKVYLYAVRPEDQTISESIEIPFRILAQSTNSQITGGENSNETITEKTLSEKFQENWKTLSASAAVGVAGLGVFIYLMRR